MANGSMRVSLWALSVGMSTLGLAPAIGAAAAAGGGTVSGVVTDSAGKPIRGAIVKVAHGTKVTARYTGSDGRYRVQGLSNGPLSVSVDAYGFKPATQQASASATNFKLTPQLDLSRLNSSEMRYLIPEDNKGQMNVYYGCGNCHGLEIVHARAGMPAEAWSGFLQHMTGYRWGVNFFSARSSDTLAPWITELFGPEGTLGPNARPDLSKVKHTPLKDAALKATITEYTIPSPGAQPHSVRVDAQSGNVWFANYDSQSNNVYRFDPKAEAWREYKIPVPNAAAHTGTVLKDGSYVVSLDSHEKTPIKIVHAQADGSVKTIEFAGKVQGSRVAVRDPSNENVIWAVAGAETWRIDLKTNQRRTYQNPKPATMPKGSHSALFGPPNAQPTSAGYDITVDSKGTPWVSQLTQAVIFSINPETGETKMYNSPDMHSARGLVADASDNVWFADYYGHKLGVLDTKTGAVTLYQPPNRYASPYGVSIDPKRGFIWYADTMPNNVTRFDPKTKEFVEYPLPTREAAPRFVGIDAQGRAWYGGFTNSRLGVIDPGDGSQNLVTAR